MTYLSISFLLLGLSAGPAAAAQFALPFRAALSAGIGTPAAAELPDEERLNARVGRGVAYHPVFSGLEWVVPSAGLPAQTVLQASNNNVALGYHEGRLFMAWRTGPVHFASREVQMHVVSSADWGAHWDFEQTVDLNSDLREPIFTRIGGRLFFSFFQAGTDRFAFEPQTQWRMERLPGGGWSRLESWGEPKEITWEIQVRRGRAWRTSYLGDHYEGNGGISLYFSVSDDGLSWAPAAGAGGEIYHGGVSEAAFEFLDDGTLWGVTRNEDGDDTGFGSQIVTATAAEPGRWSFPARSDSDRHDSPRMFKHGDDLYLLSRRDPEATYDQGYRWLPRSLRKYLLWESYGLRPKRTTLFRLDRAARQWRPLVDLPSDGDTAFPSVLRLGPHEFLIANYTSPLRYPGRSWLWGQLSPTGTQIYFTVLKFEPDAP